MKTMRIMATLNYLVGIGFVNIFLSDRVIIILNQIL